MFKRAKVFALFEKKSEFCEKSSSKPVGTFVPNQSYKISELLSRFEKGQRLPVHQNFEPGSNFTKDCLYEETFDDAPPTDIHDVADVEAFKNDLAARKTERATRKKAKKTQQAQQATPEAQQAQQVPPDPAA